MTILISLLALSALCISVIALWKTHFSKFHPISTTGDLCFRIYPIRSGKRKWFIPSLDLPISIANEGARPGRLLGIRIITRYPDVPIPNNHELFDPIWEVDSIKFNQADKKNRFAWIREVVCNHWMPFVVLPRDTVTKHIIFESRWDKLISPTTISFTAEIYTDSSLKWTGIDKWELQLSAGILAELVHVGSSFTVNKTSGLSREKHTCPHTGPTDLHKYLTSSENIPDRGFNSEPSYVDYPEEK